MLFDEGEVNLLRVVGILGLVILILLLATGAASEQNLEFMTNIGFVILIIVLIHAGLTRDEN